MYARIVNNTIAEIVDFDPVERFHPDVAALFSPAPEGAEAGAMLVDGVWVNPAPAPEPEPVPPTPPVPASITYRQFTLGLLATSFVSGAEALAMADRTIPASIDAIFDTLAPADALAARITFKTMTAIERAHPLVDQAAAAVGKTPANVDEFFRLAASL